MSRIQFFLMGVLITILLDGKPAQAGVVDGVFRLEARLLSLLGRGAGAETEAAVISRAAGARVATLEAEIAAKERAIASIDRDLASAEATVQRYKETFASGAEIAGPRANLEAAKRYVELVRPGLVTERDHLLSELKLARVPKRVLMN